MTFLTSAFTRRVTAVLAALTIATCSVPFSYGFTVNAATESTLNYSEKTGVITASALNVRGNPNKTARIIGTVKKNSSVTIVDSINGWYKIKFNSTYGYVSADYVKVESTNITNNKTDETVANTQSLQTGVITASALNVRGNPNKTAKVIGTVKKNSSATIVDSINGWYKIKFNSSYGYVSADYVKIKSTNATNNKTDETVANTQSLQTGVITASSLNVRGNPNKTAKVIGTVKKNSSVQIIDSINGWYKIKFNSTYGYVSADYVKVESTNITNNKTNQTDVNTQEPQKTQEYQTIKYTTDYYYLDKGSTLDLSFTNSGKITYSSSNSKNCPISSSGIVTGLVEGLYEITAKNESSSTATYVTVLKSKYTNIQPMRISEKGTAFIAGWEGGGTVIDSGTTVFYPYQDVSGYWTIGYGHAKTSVASKSWTEEQAIAAFNEDIIDMIGSEYILTENKPYLTCEGAKKLLNADLNSGSYTSAVSNWAIRNGVKLTQNQFDALVSFCYNFGPSYWTNDSNHFYLKSAIISHRSGSDADPEQIIEGFCRYIKSGGKNYKGLWYRRRNEAEMFITGDYTIDRSNKFTPPSDISWA